MAEKKSQPISKGLIFALVAVVVIVGGYFVYANNYFGIFGVSSDANLAENITSKKIDVKNVNWQKDFISNAKYNSLKSFVKLPITVDRLGNTNPFVIPQYNKSK